jgi:hypothetical protein
MLIILFVLFYLILAYCTENLSAFCFSSKLHFYALTHCSTSIIFVTYLFYIAQVPLYTSNWFEFYNIHLKELTVHEFSFFCAANAIGFFIAEIIYLWVTNSKRKIYLHHFVSIIGISTIYLNDGSTLFGLWCIEIASIFHKMKLMNIFYSFPYSILLVISFLLYLFMRIYCLTIVLYVTWNFRSFANIINFLVVFILSVQTTIWLFYYFKSFLMKCKIIC